MGRLWARLAAACVVAGLGLGLGAVAATPAGAQSADATVYVVHGIPGVPVDVFVNGKDTLPNFQPKTVAGPLSLPAGSYQITVYKAGQDGGTPVISTTAQVPAGANLSVVAHLDASGKPTLTPFVNDTSAVPAGQGRLIVRHTAAAPAVDILANGSPALQGLTNGTQQAAVLPAGTITAAVVAAGTTSPVLIGPAPVTVTAGMDTVVYAVGAPASAGSASTLELVTQQIPLAGSAMVVASGTGGLLDRHPGVPAWAIGLLVAAGLGAAGSTVALSRRCRPGRL
jgi:Domain of unknown function (DUF4397)